MLTKIECRSEWDIMYIGILMPEMVFQEISNYQQNIKPLSVFKNNINFHSHETLLFKEKYIPFVYDLTEEIDLFINKRVQIITKNGKGFISLTLESSNKEEISYNFSSANVLCSDIKGMRFLKKNGIKRIAMRGEFLNGDAIFSKYQSLLNILNFASKNFEEAIFRLSDINNESIIGERGSALLLNSKKEILYEELNCVIESQKNYYNLSVLCPFVRTGDESIKIYHCIKQVFSGKIGCMIEVPLIIFEGKKLAHLFDYFVIGISDLSQLLQGADRNHYAVQDSTILFIAELLEKYLLPYVNDDKIIYITSKPLFDLLKLKNNTQKILYLTK